MTAKHYEDACLADFHKAWNRLMERSSMTPRFTIARAPNNGHRIPESQIALTLMQAAAELELLPAKHYAKWGRPASNLYAVEVSALMQEIEQLAAEWRVIANES